MPRLADEYVRLCLRLRRLVPALVDPGAVDPALRAAVAAEPTPTAAALVREAGRLAEALADALAGAGPEAGRVRFLAAQVRAVEWRARRLAGQRVPFADEVAACLELSVVPGEPDAYRAAHRELAGLLPGPGPLAQRMAAHRRRDAVAADRLAPAVTALTGALRARVAPRYGLPAGEGVEHRLVADAPWGALQTYGGGYRSVVRINAGAAPGATRLARVVAHETYPGHHTECVAAEAAGRPELTVTVLGTPQTVLSEGMADAALDVALGAERGPWAQRVLAAAGVPVDGGLAARLDGPLEVLRRARVDAALLLHGSGSPTAASVAAAEAHLARWLLLDPARSRRVADALARPLWRTHVVAAVEGAALVRGRLAGGDPVVRHRALLDAPSTPAALCSRSSTQSVLRHDGR